MKKKQKTINTRKKVGEIEEDHLKTLRRCFKIMLISGLLLVISLKSINYNSENGFFFAFYPFFFLITLIFSIATLVISIKKIRIIKTQETTLYLLISLIIAGIMLFFTWFLVSLFSI